MHRLHDAQVGEAASDVPLRSLCNALLASVPGGAAVVFDREMRVWFSKGAPLAKAGVGPMVRRRVPDLMRAESWGVLKEPYEASIAWHATRVELVSDGTRYSVNVSPIALPGEAPQ